MADELRICSKAGCSHPAHASLSFRYDTRQVWVTSLTAEPEASCYDLCAAHANALTVPQGWHRIDERGQTVRKPRRGRDARRSTVPPRATASAMPDATCAAPRGGRDRYATLRAELPRLAAEIATTGLVAEQSGHPENNDARAEAEGQLVIPVEPSADGAIVVSIDQLASARRRSAREGRVATPSHLSPEPTCS